ncbi:MAG: CarD family transcriptional regulator [bacterium]|nr:CarD family transcriptional regulator [bacterium]
MFRVGDKVVYPLHGAGEIEAVEEHEVLGERRKYYVVKLLVTEMKVMIPVESVSKIGLRVVINESEIPKVLNILSGKKGESISDWKVRYTTNLEKIKSGSIYKVAEVARNLAFRSKERGLSNVERRLFDNAKQLIISELAYVKNTSADEASSMVEKILGVP